MMTESAADDRKRQAEIAKLEAETTKLKAEAQTFRRKWELFQIFLGILIPAAITLVGHWVTSAIKDREIQAKYVELGVSILQSKPTQETENLREWAVEVLNRYSGIPINEATQKDLIKNIPLPSEMGWTDQAPTSGWCYQEDRLTAGAERYSVHCHWSKERCEQARGPNARWKQSPCVLVDLTNAIWRPNPRGWNNSWYEFRSSPFPSPFPALPNG